VKNRRIILALTAIAMIDSDDRTDEEKVTDDMVYARQAMIDDYESVA